MTNLNILLAFIYVLLIALELLIVKHILNAKLQTIRQKILQLKAQIRNRHTTYNNKVAELNISIYTKATIKEFLQFALNHHIIFKFCNQDFCRRIYKMFIIGIIINNYMCSGNYLNQSFSLICTTAIQIAILIFLDYLKNKNQISIKHIFKQELEILQKQVNPQTGQLEIDIEEYILHKYTIKLFISQLIYFCLSMLAILLVTKKFYETEKLILIPIEQVKIIGLFVGSDLFIIRPFALMTYGFICYLRYNNDRELFIENNTQMMQLIIHQVIQEPNFKGLRKKSPQKQRRVKQGIEITIQDNTQQGLHTIPNPPIQLNQNNHNIQSLQNTNHHNSKQQQQSLHSHQIIVFQTLKPTQQSHSSPIAKKMSSSPSLDSETIKKQQNPIQCVQMCRNQIRQIQEFQIPQFAPNETKKYQNNCTNIKITNDQQKIDSLKLQEVLQMQSEFQLLETFTNQQQLHHNPPKQTIEHFDTTNQNMEQQNISQESNQNSESNDISQNKSKIIIKQHEISSNNFKKEANGYSDRSFHKIKYNNPSIIGKIIDQNHNKQNLIPFNIKIQNSDSNFYPMYNNNSSFIHFSPLNQKPLKQIKKKQNARNRRIHLVYTNQAAHQQNTKKTTSRNNHKQLQNQKENIKCSTNINQFVNLKFDSDKENIKSSTNVNQFVNRKFVYNSMLLPNVKPMEVIIKKQTKKNSIDNIQFAEQAAEKKRKKKRSTTRRAKQQEFLKQKSPYLQFLPKMLKKEDKKTQNNTSSNLFIKKEEIERNPSKQKSKSLETKKILKKYNQELIVIKRTLPAELETVYT